MSQSKTGVPPQRRQTALAASQRVSHHPIQRPSGFVPRAAAVRVVAEVVHQRRALDDALDRAFSMPIYAGLEQRDRAFARLIAVTVLRRYGELDAVVRCFIDKPLPENQGLLWPILLSASAQLLCLDTPPHAAISLAVEQTRADGGARRFDKLVNAVLRKVSVEGRAKLATLDGPRLNTPAWAWKRWVEVYGESQAHAIAAANLTEAALDISVKSDAAGWAGKLEGVVLPNGSIRVKGRGRIEDMPGYNDGEWWVQDAAASLPGRLLGDVKGQSIADLCAAPGGKTAELIVAGANVTAVEVSANRIARLADNLARLKLDADLVTADVTAWAPDRLFDAVLLDAPCTASGTIRRHPDILRLKREGDIAKLAVLQSKLLTAASKLVRSGGLLVYCTCSLEPEEGSEQARQFLAANPDFTRVPVRAEEIGGLSEAISSDGDLRTLPTHLKMEDPELSGLDGFYAARFRRA
ncbi:MAG: transcription antitermination factor NusB [Hyphomicrobiaceae bacterium]